MAKKGILIDDEPIVAIPETHTEEVDKEVVADAVLPSADANVVDLPSKGKLGYPSFVEYRDIMVRDEEILASSTAETYAKTLNAVVKSVMNDCPFYEKMAIHDRDYMLLWIWANNYSSTKDVEVTCGGCGAKNNHKIDLTKLPMIPIKDSLKIPFTVPVKKTGGTVSVRMSTVADELLASELLRKNPSLKYDTILFVLSIDLGMQVNFDVKYKWVSENISGREMGIIREFHSHFAFGVDTVIEHSCPACGEVTRGLVPFQTEDILFPTVSTDFEKLL